MAANIPPDYQDGDGVTIDDMNAILAVLRELRGDGENPFRDLHYALTPPTGIPTGVGSYADCTLCGRNPAFGNMVAGTKTVRVWNHPGAGAIEGGVYVVIARVQGMWTVILEPCPAGAPSTNVPTPPSSTVGTGTSTGTGGGLGGSLNNFMREGLVRAGSTAVRGTSTGTSTGAISGGLRGTGGPPPP